MLDHDFATASHAQAGSVALTGPDRVPPQRLGASLLPALAHLAQDRRIGWSQAAVLGDLEWRASRASGGVGACDIIDAAAAEGLRLKAHPVSKLADGPITAIDLPLIVVLRDGRSGVIDTLPDQQLVTLALYDAQLSHQMQSRTAALAQEALWLFTLLPVETLRDTRVDGYLAPLSRNWLRETLFPSLKPYGYVIAASLICNLLAMAGMIFSMQVYDRVIPAASYPTLVVLTCGVALAFLFEFLIRLSRSSLLDVLGKEAGLALSERVFGRALRIRADARPPSTGSFIAQLRDIDTLREQLTSASVNAVMDLPFFLLFLVILASVGGWLALIPLAAFVLMVAPALLMQGKLRAAAQGAQRESALRNAVLVEAIQGGDDIKALRAEARFDDIWRQTSLATAASSSKQKRLVAFLTTWTQTVQQGVYAATVAIGAPLVMSGQLTTGTVVGASILGARMLAPMAQISAVLTRWQQAKIGAAALNDLMHKPVDQPDRESRVSLNPIRGVIDIEGARFSHGQGQPIALEIDKLSIKAGERIGILGRNAAGKSSLLQALAGNLAPLQGRVLIDGHRLESIDPADLRRDIAWVGQNARLFHGSLRDNLRMAAPLADDAALMEALAQAGGANLLQALPKGLDHQIGEGGTGLSGGQRQKILLARAMLITPRLLLLDEPSAVMDETSERAFGARLRQLAPHQGVVIATHRLRLLDCVDRLIVLKRGKIAMDGPKDQILARLRGETA